MNTKSSAANWAMSKLTWERLSYHLTSIIPALGGII